MKTPMWRKTILNEIERHKMLRFGRRIGVAVSGGADSIFLLHALIHLDLAHIILHVNHKLRGPESDRDEAFVRGFGLPAHVATLPIIEGNTEQEARRLRYTFFEQAIRAGLCDAVATGHTLDDQAETVLSRFLRGSGTAGLSGIRPVTNMRIIRPLLGLRRADIRAFLSAQNIAWQEDCTNNDTGFTRNRIRLETMPQLAHLNPSLPNVLASTAAWAREEEDYWSDELALIEPRVLIHDREAILLRTNALHRYPRAVQRRLLRRAIEYVKGSLRSIDFHHVEAVLSMTETSEGSGRLQVPGIDAYRSFDWLRLAAPGYDSRLERDFELPLTAPGSACSNERRLAVHLQPMEMELVSGADVYNKQMNALDGEHCAGPLTLRNWRPGDAFTPAGKSSKEKIKTLFQEHRIPLWERRTWPVIASGDSILWTRRFGASAEHAASAQSRTAFEVRETGESIRTFAASNVTWRETNEVM